MDAVREVDKGERSHSAGTSGYGKREHLCNLKDHTSVFCEVLADKLYNFRDLIISLFWQPQAFIRFCRKTCMKSIAVNHKVVILLSGRAGMHNRNECILYIH